MNQLSKSLNLPTELLHVLVTLLAAWLLMLVCSRAIRILRDYLNAHTESAEDKRRIETLARVFRYIANISIWALAFMMALSELGLSIAPLLGAAGVVGIAIGFGAQSLIKDYFNGFFLLLENQVRHGDALEICGKLGVVEDITLRYVCLRDNEGNVHYVPNGQITIVTNKSRDYAYALIDLGVAYREDLDEVYRVIRETGAALRTDELYTPRIMEDVEIQGVQDWGDSAVMIRCRIKTIPLEQWDIRRAFLTRLKKAFDANNIEIPYPHLTLYPGQNKDGSAPPLRIVQTIENSK